MMDSPAIPPRPATPQVLLHRLPDRPESANARQEPSKYIILIMGGTEVAGKVHIARSVASALGCHLEIGDSVHDSSAKAASVGASQHAGTAGALTTPPSGYNEARYQRMWLAKMTRTGMLFPEESRPATEGFRGFGGTPSSSSTSRRGSASSITSTSSANIAGHSSSSVTGSIRGDSVPGSPSPVGPHNPARPIISTFPCDPFASSNLNSFFTVSEEERRRRANPALMVLTHPYLAKWHKLSIRTAVGDYGLGVIFVPLYQDAESDPEDYDQADEPPILRPLDPTTMTKFPTSFGDTSNPREREGKGRLYSEMKLSIDVNADVEGKIAEILDGVRDIMGID